MLSLLYPFTIFRQFFFTPLAVCSFSLILVTTLSSATTGATRATERLQLVPDLLDASIHANTTFVLKSFAISWKLGSLGRRR